MNYTYIVKCSDETFYTGWTNDLEKRIEMHNSGKGAKYTKARLPVELVYYEAFDTKEEAYQEAFPVRKTEADRGSRLKEAVI
jgi:putative endonuclease